MGSGPRRNERHSRYTAVTVSCSQSAQSDWDAPLQPGGGHRPPGRGGGGGGGSESAAEPLDAYSPDPE